MNIHDQLNDWADDARRTTTPAAIPIEQFTDRSRGRGLVAVAATVVLVGGIAGTVAYTTDRGHSSRLQAAVSAQPTDSTLPPPAAAGTRRVDFHGLSIEVPAKWATNATQCATPIKDTVITGDGLVPSCNLGSRPDVSSASFTTWRKDGYEQPLTDQKQRSITIDHQAAILTTGKLRGAHVTVLVIPGLIAQLTVETPSPTLGDQLIQTARVTDVDQNGCPARMSYIDLTSPPTAGPSDVMINGIPVKIAICRYLSTFLESGVTLSDTQARQLVSVLNALPSGLSAANNTYLPSLCRTAKPSRQNDDTEDNQNFSIRITFAETRPLVVYARLGLCGALGITNGTRTGQRTDDLTQQLARLGGSDVGIPGSVHPIK